MRRKKFEFAETKRGLSWHYYFVVSTKMLDLTFNTPLCVATSKTDVRIMASGTQDSRQQQIPTQRLQIYSSTDTVSPFWRGISLSCKSKIARACKSLIFKKGFFFLAEKYEREAKRYWDVFYKRHQDKVSFSIVFY